MDIHMTPGVAMVFAIAAVMVAGAISGLVFLILEEA